MANLTQNNSYVGNSGATISNSQWSKLRNSLSANKSKLPIPQTTNQTQQVERDPLLVGNLPLEKDYTKMLPSMQSPDLSQYKPGSTEYEMALNNITRNYGKNADVPVGNQFIPPIANEVVIPENYGTFANPMTIQNDTENFSWGTPQQPKLKSMSVDNGQGTTTSGQYVTDEADKNLLVKTIRGANPVADQAILNGNPSFMYQIDHIIPLEMGGADTLANRQTLTNTEHDIKSKAQSIPYTLYASGDITLSEARIMSLQWKDHDLSDIPMPDKHGVIPDVGNKTGLEIAREAKNRWYDRPVTFKDVMAEIPNTAKHLGENTPILKDSALGREFIKGFANQASAGFVPYEQGDNQESYEGGWIGGKLGQITGGVANFMLLGGIIRGSMAGVNALRGLSAAQAAKFGIGAKSLVAGAETAAKGAETALAGAKATETTFSTINSSPGYVQKILLDKALQARVAKSAGLSVVSGQAQQFVANKFNPYTLSGEQDVRNQETGELIGNVFRDLSLGAAFGLPSPTLKGVAQATALPMVMGMWINPMDPTSALVDGIAFGAMHYAGARKNTGFNDVSILGGKKYESPVIKEFNKTVDGAMYDSLRNYAPEFLPEIKKGETILPQYRTQEVSQQALNKAIKTIVKRAFFGQAASPETVQNTLGKLKRYAKRLNAKIDKFSDSGEKKTPGFFSSRKDKKAYASSEEFSNKNISKEFGKGYGDNIKFKGDLETGGMDLQGMLSEVKRVTVAARQLYKGGIIGELRGKADLDDLFSFTADNKKGRFIEQEKYVNPPIAKQVVDSIDDSFMNSSYTHFNEPSNVKSTFPTGTVAVTGFGLDINNPRVSEFLKLLENPLTAKDVSPNIIIVDRPDTASLWRLKNQFTDKKMVEAGINAIDPNPENAAQAFGVKWKKDANGNNVGKELVELGWLASEHRRQTGKNAYNQNSSVKKFVATSGAEGLRPIDFSKEDILPKMRDEGMRFMVVNLDKASMSSTKESGRSFVLGSVNDQNWIQSKLLNERINLKPNEDALSMSLSRLKIVKTPQERALLIKDIATKNPDSSSERIPTLPATASKEMLAATNAKRSAMSVVENALEAESPQALKTKLLNDLGILVEDSKAQELFDNKIFITEKEVIETIVDSVRKGNVTVEGRLNAEAIKMVDESGIMNNTPIGSVSRELPMLPAFPVKSQQSGLPLATENNPVIRASSPLTGNAEPAITNLAERIASESQKKPENKNGIVLSRKATENDFSNDRLLVNNKNSSRRDFLTRVQGIIEETSPEGGGQYLPINPETRKNKPGRGAGVVAIRLVEKIKKLEPFGVSKKEAQKLKSEVFPQISLNIANRLSSIFSMPLKDSLSLVEKITKPLDTAKRKVYDSVGKDNFFEKNLSGTTPYDALKKRRQKAGNDVISWAKTGMEKSKPGSYGHSFSYTLDSLLKTAFGDDYAKNELVKKTLGRAFGTEGVAGKNFKDLFTTIDTKGSGEEISQPSEYINALATGDKKSKESIIKRSLNRTLQDKNIKFSEKDLNAISDAGFSAGELKSVGMGVKSEKDMGMLEGLSRADFMLLPGATSTEMAGTPKEGASAVRKGVEDVRNVLQFIIKAHNASINSSKKFGGKVSEINKRRIFLTPKWYDGLYKNLTPEKKAEVNTKTDLFFDDIYRKYMDKLKTRESKQEKISSKASSLPSLKAKYEKLVEALNDPEERSNWQTEKGIKENIKSILDEIKTIKTSVKGIKNDGAGGPGVLGGLWNNIKKTVGIDSPIMTENEVPFAKNNNNNSYLANEYSPKIPEHNNGMEKAIGDHETSIIFKDGKWIKPNTYEKYHFRNDYGQNKALGYYQVTPETLFDESKKLLGRQVSPEEFLSKPDLQDKFATNRIKEWLTAGYSPEKIIKMWNVGKYGDTQSDKATNYLKKVSSFMR